MINLNRGKALLRQSKLKFALTAVGALVLSSSITAQEIPKELLDLGIRECRAGCVPSFGEKVCTQLCSCSMNEFKKRMTLPEYLALKSASTQGKVTDAQRKMMDDIAKKCDAALTIPVPKPVVKKPVPKPGEKKDG